MSTGMPANWPPGAYAPAPASYAVAPDPSPPDGDDVWLGVAVVGGGAALSLGLLAWLAFANRRDHARLGAAVEDVDDRFKGYVVDHAAEHGRLDARLLQAAEAEALAHAALQGEIVGLHEEVHAGTRSRLSSAPSYAPPSYAPPSYAPPSSAPPVVLVLPSTSPLAASVASISTTPVDAPTSAAISEVVERALASRTGLTSSRSSSLPFSQTVRPTTLASNSSLRAAIDEALARSNPSLGSTTPSSVRAAVEEALARSRSMRTPASRASLRSFRAL